MGLDLNECFKVEDYLKIRTKDFYIDDLGRGNIPLLLQKRILNILLEKSVIFEATSQEEANLLENGKVGVYFNYETCSLGNEVRLSIVPFVKSIGRDLNVTYKEMEQFETNGIEITKLKVKDFIEELNIIKDYIRDDLSYEIKVEKNLNNLTDVTTKIITDERIYPFLSYKRYETDGILCGEDTTLKDLNAIAKYESLRKSKDFDEVLNEIQGNVIANGNDMPF